MTQRHDRRAFRDDFTQCPLTDTDNIVWINETYAKQLFGGNIPGSIRPFKTVISKTPYYSWADIQAVLARLNTNRCWYSITDRTRCPDPQCEHSEFGLCEHHERKAQKALSEHRHRANRLPRKNTMTMTLTHHQKKALETFARTGEITNYMLSELIARGLIHNNKYGQLGTTERADRLINRGKAA